jgi:predicted Fe-Mo cluster-binding NifX family protein
MVLAVTIWEKRVSPVFDVATRVLVIKKDSSGKAGRNIKKLSDRLVEDLVRLEVDELICGAISRNRYCSVKAEGINIFPFKAGDVEEVIQAWEEGRLNDIAYSMPGCRQPGCCRKQKKRWREI